MIRVVVYSARAQQQLADLYLWMAEASGYPERAEAFVLAIVEYCESLVMFPLTGLARDDLRPGLRTISFRRRVVIAFSVHETTIEIHGVFYGGQDYEGLLSGDED